MPVPQVKQNAIGVQLDLQMLSIFGCVAEHFTEVAQQPEAGDVGGGMQLARVLCSKVVNCSTRLCWLFCIWVRAASRCWGAAAPAMAAAKSTLSRAVG